MSARGGVKAARRRHSGGGGTATAATASRPTHAQLTPPPLHDPQLREIVDRMLLATAPPAGPGGEAAQAAAVKALFKADGVLDDPLLSLRGHDALSAAYYLWSLLAGRGATAELRGAHLRLRPGAAAAAAHGVSGADGKLMEVDATLRLVLPLRDRLPAWARVLLWPLPNTLELWTDVRLLLDAEDGRVVRQTDSWHNFPIALPAALRRPLGAAVARVLVDGLRL